jgi:hypothetical protein
MTAEGVSGGGTSRERLHERARQLIASGVLPRNQPHRLYGGFGGPGRTCQLCEEAVTEKEVEYELEFATDGPPPSRRIVLLHLTCHAIWDYERKRATSGGEHFNAED